MHQCITSPSLPQEICHQKFQGRSSLVQRLIESYQPVLVFSFQISHTQLCGHEARKERNRGGSWFLVVQAIFSRTAPPFGCKLKFQITSQCDTNRKWAVALAKTVHQNYSICCRNSLQNTTCRFSLPIYLADSRYYR